MALLAHLWRSIKWIRFKLSWCFSLSLSLSVCSFYYFLFFTRMLDTRHLCRERLSASHQPMQKKATPNVSLSHFFSLSWVLCFVSHLQRKETWKERERERERNGKNLKNNLKIPRKCFEMFARLPFHFPLRNFVAFQSFDILWGSGDVGDDLRFWILRGFFGHWLRSFWDLTWFVEYFQDSWDFPAIGSRLSRLDWSDSLGFFRFYACVCYPPLVKQSQMKKNKKVE